MSNYKIVKISDDNLRDFINIPYHIYKKDEPWVPPLKREYKKYITGKGSAIYSVGEAQKLMVLKDNTPCGRCIVGINQELNEAKNFKEAYISEFECTNDQEAADALFQAAEDWAKERGMTVVKGPLALPGGDDNRGFLLDNFEDSTFVMNTYNPPYYNDLILNAGYTKYLDCYGFVGTLQNANIERYKRLVPLAQRRYKFTLEPLDLKNVDKELQDIKTIIEKAMPETWEDFIPPKEEEYESIKNALVPLADPDLIFIARDEHRNPIGFNITMPDYNQALKQMYGKMTPLSMWKFFYYKKKINQARLFVLFVVPEFRKKGVSSAIYLRSYIEAAKRGYQKIEGSTIWEYNKPMLLDIEKLGAKRYKTWRIYRKKI